MEHRQKTLEEIETEINDITSENVQLEQEYRVGQEAKFKLNENRKRLIKLMKEYTSITI